MDPRRGRFLCNFQTAGDAASFRKQSEILVGHAASISNELPDYRPKVAVYSLEEQKENREDEIHGERNKIAISICSFDDRGVISRG